MKDFFRKYSHAWTLFYAFIYLTWWGMLGKMVMDQYSPVHMALDDKIPFCEWFIIPYYIWFPYILIVIAYFSFCKEEGILPVNRIFVYRDDSCADYLHGLAKRYYFPTGTKGTWEGKYPD